MEVDTPEAEGVLFCQGSRFGGHSLFIKDGKLYYVYNFLGMEEQQFVSSELVSTGKLVLGAEFSKDHEEPKGVANGTLRLYINDSVVAEGAMKTQPGKFGLGAGLMIGRNTGDPVSSNYNSPFAFRGGNIKRVTINVSGTPYVQEEAEAGAMLARE